MCLELPSSKVKVALVSSRHQQNLGNGLKLGCLISFRTSKKHWQMQAAGGDFGSCEAVVS